MSSDDGARRGGAEAQGRRPLNLINGSNLLQSIQAHARVSASRFAARLLATTVFALPILSACAGGGSSTSESNGGSDGDGNPPASFFETSEFRGNFGLNAIRSSSAYAEGGTGDDVTVAVIDTGIDVDHPEFAAAIASDSINIVNSTSDVDDPDGHGTAVSGVIGARRNGEFTHGVAFDSTLLILRSAGTDACSNGCVFNQSHIATATDYAVEHGAGIINYSIGGQANLSTELEQALERAVDAGVIVVFSAGTTGGAEPTPLARFASGDTADGRAIVVGAADSDNEIAAFSDRAGSSRQAYLVAPGVEIVAPAIDGGTALFTGTSFSAAHVSGAAAVVLDGAPFLSPDDAVALLLDTATDLGEPGVDAVYGHGLVNLAAALSPQGALGVPLGESVDGQTAPLETSGLALGPAFGPGPQVARAIFLDSYGRPYRFELGGRVRADQRRPDLLRWLNPANAVRTIAAPLDANSKMQLSFVEPPAGMMQRQQARVDDHRLKGFSLTTDLRGSSAVTLSHAWGIGHRFGLAGTVPEAASPWLQGGAPLRSPYLAFTDGGEGIALDYLMAPGLVLRMGAARDSQRAPAGLDRLSRRAAIVELASIWEDGGALTAHVGSLTEETSLLDSTGGGALALDGATTNFVGVGARAPLAEGLTLFGQINYGVTAPSDANEGLIKEVSRLHSMAFAAGIAHADLLAPGDRIALMIAQPLRVQGGSARFDLPVGRTFDGRIHRRTEDIDLVPDGRELDLELAYRLKLVPAGTLSANWSTRLQPGHRAGAPPAHAIALKWRTSF